MNAELALAVLATGVAAGLLAGLLGIGGGIVFVPALLAVFRSQGVPAEQAMHLAVGSSLAAIVLASVGSVREHARLGSVDWPAFRGLLPGLLVGAALGAWLATAASGGALRTLFGVFLLVVAVQFALDVRPAPHRDLPGRVGTGAAGAVIAAVAALLGIGGGTLTAPYLVWCNRPVLRAVGTAAAAGLPIALTGALGFAVFGSAIEAFPAGTTGNVSWPVAIAVGAVAMLAAPWGARLAHRAPARRLRRLFALAQAVVGVQLLLA